MKAQELPQVVITRRQSNRRISLSVTAVAVTGSFSMPAQAKASPNSCDGSIMEMILRLPKKSSLAIWTLPFSTTPIRLAGSPSQKIGWFFE